MREADSKRRAFYPDARIVPHFKVSSYPSHITDWGQSESKTPSDVGARGYLRSQNHFPSLFRTSSVVVQAPIVSRGNPMAIHGLTVRNPIGSFLIRSVLLNLVDLRDPDSTCIIRTYVLLCVSPLLISSWLLPSRWQAFRQMDLMSLRYIVSPVTVQGHSSDYKGWSWRCQINHFSSPFFLSSLLSSSGIVSQPFPHRLRFIRHCCTLIRSSLPRIISTIVLSIRIGTRIRSDFLYHAGISLLITLLIYSTAIGPWDESILTPTTINCSTWAIAYRSAPPPFHYLQHRHGKVKSGNRKVSRSKKTHQGQRGC